MMFSTNQWAILLLVLILGWLLGLLSRSGGAKWRRLYEQERAERQSLTDAQEARIAAANARIAELERHAPATNAATAGTIGAAARGGTDDLTRIRGIDRAEEVRINDAGLHSYRDIEKMSATDEAALEGRLGYGQGRIAAEHWREQAALLRARNHEEHGQRFGS